MSDRNATQCPRNDTVYKLQKNKKRQATPSRCKYGSMAIVSYTTPNNACQSGVLFPAKIQLDQYIVSPIQDRKT